MKGILIAAIAINFMFFSCEKKCHDQKIKGKLVYTSCATAVVQILDPNYYQLGQSTWQQANNKPVFNNVFDVANRCTFNAAGLQQGDEFFFTITTAGENGCAICALWDNPPGVKQKITVVP